MSDHRRRLRISRNSIIFASGLAGIAYVTLTGQAADNATLLVLFASMIGLPAFLSMDTNRRKSDDAEKPPPKVDAP